MSGLFIRPGQPEREPQPQHKPKPCKGAPREIVCRLDRRPEQTFEIEKVLEELWKELQATPLEDVEERTRLAKGILFVQYRRTCRDGRVSFPDHVANDLRLDATWPDWYDGQYGKGVYQRLVAEFLPETEPQKHRTRKARRPS